MKFSIQLPEKKTSDPVENDIDFQFQLRRLPHRADQNPGSFEQAMLVCQCNGVSDRAIRKAVRKGAGNATEVGMRTGAATCCGGCLDTVNAIIRAESGHVHDKAAPADCITLPVVSS